MGIHDALILGLDPGHDKIGFAFVDVGGELLLSGILPSKDREAFWALLRRKDCAVRTLAPWLKERLNDVEKERFIPKLIVLGNGTCSDVLARELRACAPCGLLVVDERDTTLEARTLYWRLHRPTLWQMLLPRGLRVPLRPLDDLAAWAIALRGMA